VIRTIARRLKQLETKAAVHSVPFEPHTIVFVDVQKRVTSTMGWENGKLVRTDFGADEASSDCVLPAFSFRY
jgi:hypothetical protein